MADDLFHWHGNDLNLGPTGDLMPVGDVAKGHQRLLRRLLLSPGDMLFHPEYGAGLPYYVGEPVDNDTLEAVIRYQTALEAQVARDPEANIIVNEIFGGVQVRVIYTDSDAGNVTTLTFDVKE